MDALQWTDVDDIGYALWEAEPTFDPLTIRFTDLIDRVLALPGFQGERDRCNEKILEAIQMAWHEEYQEA